MRLLPLLISDEWKKSNPHEEGVEEGKENRIGRKLYRVRKDSPTERRRMTGIDVELC
jgi:hypothetical protein